jgi:hypothetical protein
MNGERRQARRYHWIWDQVATSGFVNEPHAAIEGRPGAREIVNLVDGRAAAARRQMVTLGQGTPETSVESLARLTLPAHHDVRAEDINLPRLGKTLAAVAERGPEDFAELLLVPGVGARTLFALALVAEVVHGVPSRFGDPARFSLAHGGKDGHPFPVPLRVYDETIAVLKRAVERAKLGEGERLAAIRRLDERARDVDAVDSAVDAANGTAADGVPTGADVARWVKAEWAAKAELGGRTVGDDGRGRQLGLPWGRG